MPVTFDTDFPGGNGFLIELSETPEAATVRFAVEPKNCPEPLWFHFRLTGLSGRRVRCVMTNPEQTLGGADWSRNRPVFRPTGGDWRRAPLPEALRTSGDRCEWAWDLDAGDTVEFANCYPYQPTDLESTLDDLGDSFRTETIGVTPDGRELVRVYSELPSAEKPAVLLAARHHAGETPGSWVLDGLLRRVAEDQSLRQAVTFWAIPIVNIDDAVAGSYGKDPYPHDCNRAYGEYTQRRPEAFAITADARRLKSGCGRMFAADLHAPSHGEQRSYVPLHGWDGSDEINPIAQQFAERFRAAVPEQLRSPVPHVTPTGNYTRQPGMSFSRWMRNVLGVECVSLETSYQGNGKHYYTIDDYRTLGATLARTIADWVT
ncbi:MAG: M14-type cytosolic carboxypeptidase [Phycisphaerae bacterium]